MIADIAPQPGTATRAATATATARQWRIGGRVQGVGFRPFVYRLAHDFGLQGWVRNSGGVVEIQARGPASTLSRFGHALLDRAPPASRPHLLEEHAADDDASTSFRILASTRGASAQIHVPPDLFACDDCLAELRDPAARRYRYPFINCTQCGPRYTLIERMPYDRPNTTMAGFALCADCAAEYADPLNRRFHAQPLACPVCGPQVRWSSEATGEIADPVSALASAIAALRQGDIVALRGIGGYHLLCDAGSEQAVARLRVRKRRPAKPLALMVPWRGDDGLDGARALAELTPQQCRTLLDSARPIVLTTSRDDAPIAAAVAPGLREVGLMLAYSPLHHLLLDAFAGALVATSGNLSGEPVLTEPDEAQTRLAGIADGFLHHNRPIARPADDPVVRCIAGVMRPLRLGRGTAPLELKLPTPIDVPTLAVGAFLKNTVALAWNDRAVVSPHIGDLTGPRGRAVFVQVVEDLQRLYGVRALRVAHDAHPDFPNTRWARTLDMPALAVWHHHAHAAAVAGEFPHAPAILCFTWDGVGLGPDGTLWGGEALLGRPGAWRHAASFRTFPLPGGERATHEPWRSALALCWESHTTWKEGEQFADPLLRRAFERRVNCPRTSAVGRLFDAAAALLQVCQKSSYEGEAPMRLEAVCQGIQAAPVAMPLARGGDAVWRSDWSCLMPILLDSRIPTARRAAIFHASLAQALCDQALVLRDETGVAHVGLSGGVFQNRILTERVCSQLRSLEFEVVMPQLLPVNDAAISFGQLIEAAASPLH
ncbi:MAG: carbamoyltransferase HypF [Rudaea sp.]